MMAVLVILRGLGRAAQTLAAWRTQLAPREPLLLAPARGASAELGRGLRRLAAGLPRTEVVGGRPLGLRSAPGRHLLVVDGRHEPVEGALERLRQALRASPRSDCLRFPEGSEDPAFPWGQRRLFGVPLRATPGAPLVLSPRLLRTMPWRAWLEAFQGSGEEAWLAIERTGGGTWFPWPLLRPGPARGGAAARRALARWIRERRLDVQLVGGGRELEVRARRPRGIDIELTNRCNSRCSFCPRDRCRRTGDMRPEIFERVLEFIREEPIGTIYFIGRGEPLVHPRFLDYVRRIRQRSGIHFEVFTNGLALTPELVDALARLNDPELDIAINVSLHSLRADTHHRLTGGDLSRVAANLRHLQTRAADLRVSYAFVTSKINEAEMAVLRRHLDRTGNTAWDISLVYNKGGLVPPGPLFDDEFYRRQANWDPTRAEAGVGPCWYSYCGAYYWVNYRGEFTLCHDDYLDETILGRVGREGLADIDRRVEEIAANGGAPRCRRCTKRLRELHHGENRESVAQVKDRFRPGLAGSSP
ncbi:MAG TPA: radical SAM/SPASM domain-containing protein [Myxococcota bacterium]|nr:radical SAM/SPASM domain-containing protein [Myxococcota bacterium]HRY94067.1 radical SAM/SPASM domain-containing protein [Myxococcota bacterium]